MSDNRYMSSDIDPNTDTHVNDVREKVLGMLHGALKGDDTLHNAAQLAILNDFDGMDAQAFLKQLRTYSLILDAFRETAAFPEMVGLLANLLRSGIHKVDGSAMDCLSVRRDAIQMNVDGNSTIIGTINGELLSILSLGKESREAERQLRMIERLVAHRNEENLRAVADAFKIPEHDTEKITLMITRLFDGQGSFVRKTFEPMIEELAHHGNHAFELLWCYFKVLKSRPDRVAFLNALQHLISRINRPKHALRFLLADFCRYPDRVEPSDRNAIMLANILLRTYNKELDVDIEMTPEEVLNVRNGLDQDVIRYVQFRLDAMDHRFTTKVRTIHEKMVARLEDAALAKQMPSVRHLLFLEREILIFLSLLAGKTAHLILSSALGEYGDPDAGIYRHLRAKIYLPVFLQHLKIVVRGMGRVGSRDDVAQLRQVSENGLALAQLNDSTEYQRSVVRTMAWIENAIRGITTDSWQQLP